MVRIWGAEKGVQSHGSEVDRAGIYTQSPGQPQPMEDSFFRVPR